MVNIFKKTDCMIWRTASYIQVVFRLDTATNQKKIMKVCGFLLFLMVYSETIKHSKYHLAKSNRS